MLKLPRFGIAGGHGTADLICLLCFWQPCYSAQNKTHASPCKECFSQNSPYNHSILIFQEQKGFPNMRLYNPTWHCSKQKCKSQGFWGGPGISGHFLNNRSSCNPSASNSNFPIRVNKKPGIAHAPKCHGTTLLQEMNQSITRFTIKPGPSLKLVSCDNWIFRR